MVKTVYALCFAKDMGISVEVQGLRLKKGSGDIILTGNVGELARDSVIICKTLLGIKNPDALTWDYHLHFQYLQLKKDGPSWGLACFILLCLLSETRIKYSERLVSATGELDLYGNVKPVGYLKEKIQGISQHVKYNTIIIPKSEDILVEDKQIYQISNISELFIGFK